MLSKVTDAARAISLINDGAIVAISGFNMPTTPEYLILELYNRYAKTGHPKNIFIISDTLPAMPGKALDLVAERIYAEPHQDFLRGALMPFLGFSPWLARLVTDDRVECFGWPIGITAYWFREVASGRPGLITKIGLDTFLDPRREGGCLNARASSSALCKVSVIDIEGEEHLLYRAPKPNFALIRASVADEYGNLSMEDEAIRGTVLSIAQAAKARPNQGTVIGQVRWLARSWTINSRDVDVPGPLVDHIAVAPKEYHWQTGASEYDPRLSHKVVPPITEELARSLTRVMPTPSEKVIARRVIMELTKLVETKRAPILVNLGIGIPAFVSSVATEENITDFIQTVLESGLWGGLALSGSDFGLAISPFAMSTIPDMFSNFEGGIIDAACLGFLQIDKEGNVNPSILPDKIYGPGGFPVIAGGAPRTYFAGAFTAGPCKIDVQNNRLQITRDGPVNKFLQRVFRVVFSGREATKYGHDILYITERAVFRLTEDGIALEEVAPGVNVEEDILSKMEFMPKVTSPTKEMDERLYRKEIMGIREDLEAKIS